MLSQHRVNTMTEGFTANLQHLRGNPEACLVTQNSLLIHPIDGTQACLKKSHHTDNLSNGIQAHLMMSNHFGNRQTDGIQAHLVMSHHQWWHLGLNKVNLSNIIVHQMIPSCDRDHIMTSHHLVGNQTNGTQDSLMVHPNKGIQIHTMIQDHPLTHQVPMAMMIKTTMKCKASVPWL